jgi:Undecaprenyl-phosphate glucose phosphotransferase
VTTEINGRIDLRAKEKHISLTFVRNLAQVLDPLVIVATGLVACTYIVIIADAAITSRILVAIIIGAMGFSLVCNWFDLYNDSCLFYKNIPFRWLLISWGVVSALLLFAAFALKVSSDFSRVWAVSWFAGGACALLGSRLLLQKWVQQQVRHGTLVERAVVLGAGELGAKFAAQMNDYDEPFPKIIGYIDDRKTRVPLSSHGYDLLGNTENLIGLIRADQVDHVFLALPTNATDRVTEILNQLTKTPVRVSLVLSALEIKVPNKPIKYLGKSPTLEISDQPLKSWSYAVKQLEDKILAALILSFIAPLLLFISFAIKLDSPGPVFFRQKRYGFNDRPIHVWKFRTMHVDSCNAPGTIRQTIRDDPRVTRIGRFLRRSSLDELPQFFNVLSGEMSVVGPRPHAVEHRFDDRELAETVDRYAARHRVKPGITGWAQVNGWRGETDSILKLQKRVEHDLYYIDQWTIWFDFMIIWRTIFVLFKDDQAY